jgi:hypothetical protein
MGTEKRYGTTSPGWYLVVDIWTTSLLLTGVEWRGLISALCSNPNEIGVVLFSYPSIAADTRV